MTEGANNSNPPQPAELVVSAERHQRLHDIVLYVKALHRFIDPDMYRISLKKLEELEWCVEGVEFESEGVSRTSRVHHEGVLGGPVVSGNRRQGGGYLFAQSIHRLAG